MNGQPDNGIRINARHVIVRRTNVHDPRWAAAVAIAAADVVFEDGNVYNTLQAVGIVPGPYLAVRFDLNSFVVSVAVDVGERVDDP
jgi:hypothetical protein